MKRFTIINNSTSINNIWTLFIILLLPFFIFACSTTRETKKPLRFSFEKPILSKKIKDQGTTAVPLSPTTLFTTQDHEVIASINLRNLSGRHTLRYDWYSPDDKLYHSTGNRPIGASREKYIKEATAWHRLSIRSDRAENYPGKWKVNIYFDNELIASRSFEIKSDIGLPPILSIKEISLSEKVLDAGETAELKVSLKNTGPGDARDVYVSISGGVKGLSFNRKSYFPTIRKRGGMQTVSIPISGGMDIPTLKAYLDIQVIEPHFKVRIRGKRLTFQTRKFRNPELMLAQFATMETESSAKNRQIDLNEIFDLRFAVQNVGKGTAEDVTIEVENNQEGVMFLGVGEGEKLARQAPQFDNIGIGKYKIINYRYFASSEFHEKVLKFTIKASEKYGKYGFSETRQVAINTELKEEGYIRKVSLDDDFVAGGVTVEDIPAFEIDVDVNIPKTKMRNPHAIALIIGNRIYEHKDVPDVIFAHNDAEIVKQDLIKTLGYKEGNIIFETDVTKAKFEALLGIASDYRGTLYDYIKPGKSDVFIYYSGHGAPDPNTQKGFFMPVNCDPAKVALNGYPLNVFYENLSKLDAKSITVVIDACFSGGTSSGELLIDSASPIGIKVDNPAIAANKNTIILASSKGNQISSWYDEKKHSLFTYFFLKALGGAADMDGDSVLTFKEIYDFVSDRAEGVPYWAKRLHGGRIQTPDFQGTNKNKVLVRLPKK